MDLIRWGLLLAVLGYLHPPCHGVTLSRRSGDGEAGGGRGRARLRIRVTRAQQHERRGAVDEPWRVDRTFDALTSNWGHHGGEPSANQPLWGLFQLFGEQRLEGRLAAMGEDFTAMELGCGEGRALLELQARFPSAKLICINSPEPGQHAPERGSVLGGDVNGKALLKVAERYGIDWHPDTHNTPQVITTTQDASMSETPVASGSVDVLFSRSVLGEGSGDVEFVDAALRLLKPHGEAFIHLAEMEAKECARLARPGAPPLTLLCKSFPRYGKCLKVAVQYADLRRYAGGRVWETAPTHAVGLVDDCSTSCDDEDADAVDKLSYACDSSLPELVTTKLKKLASWQGKVAED